MLWHSKHTIGAYTFTLLYSAVYNNTVKMALPNRFRFIILRLQCKHSNCMWSNSWSWNSLLECISIDVTKLNEFQLNFNKWKKLWLDWFECFGWLKHRTHTHMRKGKKTKSHTFKVLQFNGWFSMQLELQTWRIQPKIGDTKTFTVWNGNWYRISVSESEKKCHL